MWFSTLGGYRPLYNDTREASQSTDSLEVGESWAKATGSSTSRRQKLRSYATIILILVIIDVVQVVLLVVFCPTFRIAARLASVSAAGYHNADLNEGLKLTSAFSPILDTVDMHLHTATFNGALRDNTSIWRMSPPPEVDAAWNWISAKDMQLVTVSAADVANSGKDASISVEAPSSWSLGDDAYIAQVEVFHQIHCLDELRKEIYSDYYYPGRKAKGATELDLSHKNHCVHMLLQTLMCNADVGIITHYWLHDDGYSEPKTKPFPDFNVEKKCRDFGSLMDWLREKGGVKDLAAKFPMEHPEGAPITYKQGYSVSLGED